MKIIVGLGNPGLRYKATRHNVGFEAIDRFAKANRLRFKARRYFDSWMAEGKFKGESVLLLKPLTYMNRSGVAVAPAVANKEVNLSDLLVVCDDVNLELGQLRLRAQGSAGGHNGLISIIERLGNEAFSRLRIGVGGSEKEDLTGHVLGRFKRQENKVVDDMLQRAADCIEVWFEDGIKEAMNRFNKK
ncbi:MAG: aminoacyl-tRNA hydrolase [Candidatus Omnitrophica bacterium]|nr:aminoacyl-tRNA hydrolase [Candidatus Omnitrophota bacterium]